MKLCNAPAVSAATLYFGAESFDVGSEIVELRVSNDIAESREALHARMEQDGYLFFRGFFDREQTLAARMAVLRHIAAMGCLDPETPIAEGIVSAENRSLGLFRDLAIAHSPEILALVDGPEIRRFFTWFLGGEILTFDKRWLRAMATGGFSGWHYDSVFMNRGTRNLYTCWTPIGDISLDQGPLAILLGSHRLEQIKKSYGAIDVDRDHLDPIFTTSPREMIDRFGCTLATTHFRAGDLLIFGLYMMHGSFPNATNRYRISIDTRYQLASEPVDDRFMGKNGTWKGNYSYSNPAPRTPMQELRAKWGLD
ncbi:MAG TPA: phytanoyl-CoA dioxygenase family protein [Armatimonadota bacterium]|nr:phytanoyl-CoA dioxygenase family protein [Armatimonadota bacterium]